MKLSNSVPKPKKRPARARQWNSTIPRSDKRPPRSSTPIAKVGKQKAKRQARNKAYYASREWRAKRKAVFERDGYQCTEAISISEQLKWMREDNGSYGAPIDIRFWRCPNRGEIVNGKQTGRGLVCEETSYGHRGNESYIDTCKTRCKECDRRLTPLERINHSHGFNNRAPV